MLVECEARSTYTFYGDSDLELDKTYFRVLSFKIFHANKDWGNEK